jgi:hypothetical protein
MSDEQKPWERKEGEPNRWFQRFEAFRLMGPGRSLTGCVNEEKVRKGQKESSCPPGSWRRAAEEWLWRERAAAWDAHLTAERDAAIERAQAEADAPWLEKLMRKAEALGRLAEIGRANPYDFLVRGPKEVTVGSGERAQTIWIESASLNWDALRERGYLVKKISFTQYGPVIELKDSSGAIEKIGENLNLFRQQTPANLNIDMSLLSDEQVQRIADGEDPIRVLAAPSESGA